MASNSFNYNTGPQSGRGQTVVLTLDQLEQSTRQPTLRLTLRQRANQLHGSANLNLNSTNHIKDNLGKLMKKARKETDDLLSEEKHKSGKRKEDKKVKGGAEGRLNNVFDGLNEELEKLRQMSLASLEGMSPEEQEQVVLFWQNFSGLFSDLMGLVGDLFKVVCLKIREGYTIDRGVLTELFDEIFSILKNSLSSSICQSDLKAAKHEQEEEGCHGEYERY